MSNISQVELNTKINRFIELESGKKTNYIGLCFAYAVVYAYMAAIKKLGWWRIVLVEFSEWDGKSLDPLKNIFVNLPQSNGPESLYNIFRRAVDYLLFNYGCNSTTNIDEMQFEHFLTPNSLFLADKLPIKYSFVVAGFMTSDELDRLLCEDIFGQEAIYRLSGEYMPGTGNNWIRHACSIRFHQEQWHFYDPDVDEISFKTKGALIEHIFKILGHSLTFHIASWKDEIAKFHERLCSFRQSITQEPMILNELGFNCIAKYSSEQLATVFDIADSNNGVQNALARALTTPNKENICGLFYMIVYSPEHFSKIIDFSKRNNFFLQKFGAALNIEKSNGALNGLQVLIISNEPNKLIETLELACTATDPLFLDSISSALKSKNSAGWTTVDLIASVSTDLLLNILDKARQSKCIRDALFSSLPAKYENSVFQNAIGNSIDVLKKMAALAESKKDYEALFVALEISPNNVKLIVTRENLTAHLIAIQVFNLYRMAINESAAQATSFFKENRHGSDVIIIALRNFVNNNNLAELDSISTYAPAERLTKILREHDLLSQDGYFDVSKLIAHPSERKFTASALN